MIPLFIDIRLLDIIDIILVAALMYWLYRLLKGTSGINIFVGIVAIFLIWQVVSALQMEMLSSILGAFVSGGFIALFIIFQPEIRHFLFTIGTQASNRKFHRFRFFRTQKVIEYDTEDICKACVYMGEIKQGALIILTRQNAVPNIVETGITVDARISPQLIENIFFKNSPLHDGAMVITQNRIVAAHCILPLTNRNDLPSHYGLRHRAAIGISEKNDSLVIVVSEETGSISIAQNGNIKSVKPQDLKAEVDAILAKETT